MTTYDLGAVNISLPQIMTSYQTNISTVSWVLLSYLLTTTALLLPAGRLGDFIGRKKVYNLGFAIFVMGSALCLISQTPLQLIFFRVLQGVGASMLQTNSFAIVAAVFPEKERGKGLGFNSTMAAIGITAGPAIGGFIVHFVGWKGIFFLNIPVGLVGIVLGHLVLKEELVSPRLKKGERHFDLAGAVLVAVGMISLMIGLSLGREGNWSSAKTGLFLGGAALAIVVFPWFESRRMNPLVDIGLFKNRTFGFNNVARLMCFLSTSSYSLLMPFFLQVVKGYSPFRAGLLIAPVSLVFAAVSPVSGWLTNYIATRFLASIGMALMGLSFYSLSHLNPSSGYSALLGGFLLLGLGSGVFQTPNNTSVMDSVSKEQFGMASGILALVRQVGQALGIAIATTIVAASMFSTVGKVSLYSLKMGGRVLEQDGALAAFADGIGEAFFVASILCLVGAIFSFIRGKTARDEGKHAK